MEQLITEGEIEEIINKLKAGKTPGTELGPQYYEIYFLVVVGFLGCLAVF